METCNGSTHSWSDDSYSQGSYPCPGPEKCANAARLKKENDTIKITEADLKSVFGYDMEALARQNVERTRARLEAAERAASLAVTEEEIVDFDSGSTQEVIREVCDGIRDFLLDKNAQYGDSAIDPVRIFSKASPIEQLLVRIDDKLSRIEKGDDRIESDDDVIDDLIGYFILLKVAKLKGLS